MDTDCIEDSVFDFPPLTQDMRLNIQGGPTYRGGRGGRAAAAYYREKEAIIAVKNKYGNRFGRRIQMYKPDNEAWKSERYQRSTDFSNTRSPEIIPGGLQNKKSLINIHHDWLAQTAAKGDQQGAFSLRGRIHTKYSSETGKSEGVPVEISKTFHTADLVELKIPSSGGRGMMRGKRVVDMAILSSVEDGTVEFPVKGFINLERSPVYRNTKET